jgi:hypothetical protein
MDHDALWEIAKLKAEIILAVEFTANEIRTAFMKNFNSVI